MKCLWWTVLLIIQLSKRLHGQCIPIPNVTPAPGDPSFPVLPDTFQTRVEANIKDKQKTFIAEEYYDYSNKKATLKITGDDETIMDVFDYKYNQLFHIFGNGSCAVMNISASKEAILFGTATKPGGVPHIFTTSGVLHFLKKSGQVYKGKQYVRGVNTDHWSTCLIWDTLNATFTLDYFFTTNDWNTAAGFPQIPVRAIATGKMNIADGTSYQFEHYYEYVDFRVDLDVDYSIFETPKGVYCPGRKVTRNITRIASPSVHYQMEVISTQSVDISSFDVWYDSDLQLARYDYKNRTSNPLREIHDFSTGIKYITDMVTGSCTILPLSNNSNDVNQRPFGDQMKDINHFMFLDGNYYYSGKRTARGLPCDVFTARKLFPFNNIQYNATFEFYFLESGYKEYPSDGTTAPNDIPIRLEVSFKLSDMGDTLLTYNFLSYDIGKRAVSDFDISACYENLTSLRFQLRLPGPFRQQDTDLLKTEAQRVLPSIMNVTKVRLQSLRVDFDPSTVYLSGTLIDIAPDYAKFTFATTISNPVGTTISTKDVDRSVAFTSTWKDCATRCIQNYDFICNSFDFCPKKATPMCHLYKDRRTSIKVYLQNHASPCLTYSVYQRTVNGISNQETAVFDAYGHMRDAINKKGVHLQTFDPNGVVTDYYPVEVEIISGVLETQTDMPSLSGQFSFRQEITFPGLKLTYGSDIWYDFNFKIARYDIIHPGAPYYTEDPLINIQDYNSGVLYVIDKGMQNCTIKQISDFSFSNKQHGIYSMKNPLELFRLNRTYTFVGQRMRSTGNGHHRYTFKSIRGLTCDIFEATVNDFRLDFSNPETYTSTFQYYFLKDDWTSNSDTSFGPTRAQPIRLDISSVQKGLYLTYNLYNWNNHDPDLTNFNIVPCYTGDQQKHFSIVFTGQYHPYLESNSKFFKLAVHNKLSQMTNASVIRFQQPQIDYGLTNVYVIMTVVDQAPQIDGVPYLPEPDTDSIIDILNDNIYSGLLTISVPQTDGSIYTFNATAITDNILRNDGRPLSSKTMSHFKVLKHKSQKSLSGYLSGISVDECADACLTEITFDCYSFVYCPRTGVCLMAKTYAQQRPDLVYDRPNCDLFYRSYVDKFTEIPGQLPILPASQTTTAAATAEVCAQKCINGASTCNSFVYCLAAQTCSLLKTHHLDIPKMTSNKTGFNRCSFYSRSYLNDFKKKTRSTMKFTQVLDIEAVSVDQCAQLCIQTEAFSCNSFAFCGNSTTCRLTPSHPTRGMRVVATDYCDLYTRTYYANGPPTKLTQSSSASSKGYTSGAMAGVSIALLLVGIVLGGGLILLLSKKQKMPKMELFNMNYREPKKENNINN